LKPSTSSAPAIKSPSIKAFVIISSLIVSGVTFLVVFGVSLVFYLYQEGRTVSEFTAAISRQSFGVLQGLMQEGWNGKQLQGMLERYRESLPASTTIALYRNSHLSWDSPEVVEQQEADANVLKAFPAVLPVKNVPVNPC